MIIEEILELIIPYITGALEFVGVFIITIAAIQSIYKLISKKFDLSWDAAGVDFAKAMQLSLEFKLGAEIIKTVVVRTIEEFVVLAAVAILRVVLSFVLHWELTSGTKSHTEIPEKIKD